MNENQCTRGTKFFEIYFDMVWDNKPTNGQSTVDLEEIKEHIGFFTHTHTKKVG